MSESGQERRSVHINVPVLARVEGEGALELRVEQGVLESLQLRIFEPPRFFEKFLEGREDREVIDFVARICGICPVAYQMSAVQALEAAYECAPDAWVTAMRRLLYCGEWIQSHALHIHLLAAPDFLGYANAMEMAQHYPDEVRRGLRLQSLGNRIIALLGGRSVHPVGVSIGGFHGAPDPGRVTQVLESLRRALPEAEALVAWTMSLALPADEQSFISVALRNADEYPMNWGRIVSSAGLDIDISEYTQHFAETHHPHSTALYSHLDGSAYLVGPLARLNLNHDRLPSKLQELIADWGQTLPSANMFHSIVARALELYYALLEAERLLDGYQPPAESSRCDCAPKAAVGYGCTEAPRGLLWHRYEMDADGRVVSARIVPPTSQNQARIEEDLAASLTRFGLNQDDDALRLRAETVIRNYDPCISCATHFLSLDVHRDESASALAAAGSDESEDRF